MPPRVGVSTRRRVTSVSLREVLTAEGVGKERGGGGRETPAFLEPGGVEQP